MKRIPRRIFQEEFKREAIKLVNEQGLSISEACKKLDIATKSLRTWMKQEQNGELKSSLGANKLTADQLRIRVTSEDHPEDHPDAANGEAQHHDEQDRHGSMVHQGCHRVRG